MDSSRPDPGDDGPLLTPDVRAFLDGMTVPAVLATVGRSGGPVTSSVWYAREGEHLLVSTPRGGTKARNVEADGRVSFLVDTRERPYRGVAVEGQGIVQDDPGGQAWRAIATRYLGEPLPQDIVDRFRARPRVLIRVVPRRVREWNLTSSASGG